MQPACDHNIVVHSHDRISVRDAETGEEHATARRSGGVWNISADGVPDVSTQHLHEADGGVIGKIAHHAKLKLHATPEGEGFSTWVPHEARKLHGEDAFNAWKDSVGLHDLKF